MDGLHSATDPQSGGAIKARSAGKGSNERKALSFYEVVVFRSSAQRILHRCRSPMWIVPRRYVPLEGLIRPLIGMSTRSCIELQQHSKAQMKVVKKARLKGLERGGYS